MYRTHTCGQLRPADINTQVTLAGWVHVIRDLGGRVFIDLRDRYGITQINIDPQIQPELYRQSKELGREYVIQVQGTVTERSNKNPNIPTGGIEIAVLTLNILNASKTPPFTIEDSTDGGDDLRMKYRYLDLRRKPVQYNLLQRHRVAQAVRRYFDAQGFADIETPFLIKSTPEGARDFVVPSRLSTGQFYALPQSPQTFKQLLMVSGFDRYYQITRCFRDEDLRADRQPEFTQIDCEMSFVEQEDVLNMMEGMVRSVFNEVRGTELGDFVRMTYADALHYYGCDKPDLRFDMKFKYIKTPEYVTNTIPTDELQSIKLMMLQLPESFKVFDDAEAVIGICAKGCAEFTRKQLDELTEYVKRPQVGMGGMAWLKVNLEGTIKASFEKFYSEETLKYIANHFNAQAGDLILILSGTVNKTRKALNELRLEMGNRLGLRKVDDFKPLWVLDFPLLEWDADDERWNAMHHPFTSWKTEDEYLLDTDPGRVRANAYDVVINGVELASGSIRIHSKEKQHKMFELIGLSKAEAEYKFGFILNAFEYGAPPHGGIAFGFDRFCSIVINNQDYIRDYIAFPKNNSGRDMMLDAPSDIDDKQKKELGLK